MTPNSEPPKMPTVILLDVYETMFDLSDVERRVNSLLDSKRGYIIWMELFMQYCFVDNCTVQFNDFPSIAKATMQMAAATLNERLEEYDIHETLELLKQIPLHSGVPQGLSLLNDLGFRVAALTNSPEQFVRNRMERTGLISFFEKVLSAEHVKKYKPCIEVYEWATDKMQVAINDALLVSAHGWDIAGGANAGMQTAYVDHGQMLYPLAPKPTFTCTTIEDLAQQLQAIKEPTKRSVS